MSRNPYAQPEPFGAGPDEYVEPQRVSMLAVTSFVLSLICCIPGVSLIGAILGGLAIVRISQAGGRLSGRGLAIAGLVLGLLFTMLWVGLTVGAGRAFNELAMVGQTMEAIDQRDYVRARQNLTPAAEAVATDTRLEEFRAEINAEWGSYQRMPRGLGEWFSAYFQVMQRAGQQGVQFGTRPGELPVPVYYDNGQVLVIFMTDAAAGASPGGMALFSDIIVYDQQGNPMSLIPPGTVPPRRQRPAAPPAGPVDPPEAAPDPAQTPPPPPDPAEEPSASPGPG